MYFNVYIKLGIYISTATLTKQLDDEDKVDCDELNLEKV